MLLSPTASAQSLPKPAGRVNDFANVIDPAVEAEIDRRLDQVEQQTSSEIAVATVESLAGMSVEEYANRLFKEWGVGQAKQDNGVLILVAPNEREMRIEVGYGLEGVLPDGLAGQVIRDNFTPRFRDGDYSGGIRDGLDRIATIVERQQVLTPEELAKFNQSSGDDFPIWLLIPFFGVFVTIGFGMVGIGLRTKTGFPLLFGSFFGGMPLVMSLAFLGRLSLMTLLPWSLAMFVVGYRLGGRKSWRDAFRDSGGRGSGGSSSGWTMGNTSSGSSSGSSSSSSSFGGGSSGGGGASGRW
ncbi:MAG TPA: TPM domain-containing protein [Vicinamibacterales bacterium]|nr:TPM domain-containing protein [Vicinamibacterales bacterium]